MIQNYTGLPTDNTAMALIDSMRDSMREIMHNIMVVGGNVSLYKWHKADLSSMDLKKGQMSDSDMRGANFNKADLENARLDSSNLFGANLTGANLRCASLIAVILKQSNCGGANLDGINAAEGDLSEAILSHTSMKNAIFYKADLRGADGHVRVRQKTVEIEATTTTTAGMRRNMFGFVAAADAPRVAAHRTRREHHG